MHLFKCVSVCACVRGGLSGPIEKVPPCFETFKLCFQWHIIGGGGGGWRVTEREGVVFGQTHTEHMPEKEERHKTDRDLEEGKDGGRGPGREGDLCNVTSSVDGKMISPTRICSPSLQLAHCGNIASLNCKLRAANIPNSWTLSTSMHPERLLMLHHSTSAFIFYFKHTFNKPNIGTQRGSTFYHTFQDHRNRSILFFSPQSVENVVLTIDSITISSLFNPPPNLFLLTQCHCVVIIKPAAGKMCYISIVCIHKT